MTARMKIMQLSTQDDNFVEEQEELGSNGDSLGPGRPQNICFGRYLVPFHTLVCTKVVQQCPIDGCGKYLRKEDIGRHCIDEQEWHQRLLIRERSRILWGAERSQLHVQPIRSSQKCVFKWNLPPDLQGKVVCNTGGLPTGLCDRNNCMPPEPTMVKEGMQKLFLHSILYPATDNDPNGTTILSYPFGLAFSAKHSKLFVTDRVLHAVFMVDMHCPANVTLIAGGVEPGHANGHGRKTRFRNPAGVVAKQWTAISQEEEESENEEEEFAIRRVRKEVLAFERSSVLTALAFTRDEHYILVGDCDENSPSVHLCQVEEGVKIRAISNIPGPMGIAVMEEGTVFMSSSKEHALYSLNEEEMLEDTDALITNKIVWRRFSVMAGYANIFRLDKKAKEDHLPVTFDDNMKHVQEVVACFSSHEQEALEKTGKRNTNGPDMTIPWTTRQSFQIVLDSPTNLVNTLTEIGQDRLLNGICFESMTTLGVECFSKECVQTMTCLKRFATHIGELAVWKMTCYAFIKSTSPSSWGQICTIPRKSLKVIHRTSSRAQTSRQESAKERETKKKIRGKKTQ
ncbi:hypothetical protein OS493_027268 [Desmophyllum pertusum]|uniref:Uncharacterized protein n=1 Tax=Desmophyllum pertusum TaxID=174260 RepID=A0A9W9ZA30_9CNID|nr:hypothetical protein OS493_027268 [Desmophyllum pertusum]